MNVNVLKITSTPIQLSITSERARLEVKAPDSEAMAAPETQKQLNMKPQNIKVDIGSSRTQNGMEYRAAGGAASRYSRASMQSQPAVKEAVSTTGNMVSTTASTVTTGKAAVPADEIPGLAVDFKPRMVTTEDNNVAAERAMEYVPGELKISVEQRPKVEIEYVGGPIYFPKSTSLADE